MPGLTDKDYLALTIIGEARGEPIEGIVGVANVIKNRVKSNSTKTFKDICLSPNQFSCWNSNDPNYKVLQNLIDNISHNELPNEIIYRECFVVADAIYNNAFKDNVMGAKNYVTVNRYNLAKTRKNKDDEWIINMQPVVTLGHHIFLV